VEVLRPASIALDKLPPEKVVEKGSLYWQTMARMFQNGYHTAYLAPDGEQQGLDALSLHIMLEELAYGSVGFAVSLSVSLFCALGAQLMGSQAVKDKFLTPFINCRDAGVMGYWGATEPEHGSDMLMTGSDCFCNMDITHQVEAVKEGSHWVLNGQKSAWVSNGPTASQALLFVNVDPSLGMAGGGICLVELDVPGVSRGKPLDKMGQRELPQGELFFDNVTIPGDCMIIDPTGYVPVAELVLTQANMCMGSFFTGLAQACYDLALQYSRERVQGGRRLCEHAYVQAKLFDMFTAVEACRAMSRRVMLFNKDAFPPSPQYSIASKVFCTNSALKVAGDAVQLFGGLGLSREMPIEKLYRDARAGLIEDGSNDSLSIAGGGMLVRQTDTSSL
jgi:alkylation response protein AidB-like acyl-CoA dehydrogenase